jgi:hypothetical protein
MDLDDFYKDWYHKAGDVVYSNRANRHYLLLAQTPADLSSWTVLAMETGRIFVMYGVGKTEHSTDLHWKKVA